MKNFDDEFEEKKYEDTIKENFARKPFIPGMVDYEDFTRSAQLRVEKPGLVSANSCEINKNSCADRKDIYIDQLEYNIIQKSNLY